MARLLCKKCFQFMNVPLNVTRKSLENNTVYGLTSKSHEYRCNTEGCDGGVFEVDDILIPVIELLNTKGYKTTNCCSSHSSMFRRKSPSGMMWSNEFYIIFEENTSEQLNNLLPEGFVWGFVGPTRTENKAMLRKRAFDSKDLLSFQISLFNDLNILLEWAINLPSIR